MKTFFDALGGVVKGLAVLVCAAGIVRADYSLGVSTFNGGGGTSAGGPYSVNGVAGQSFVGVFNGGPYTVVTGSQNLVAVVQSPGAPVLTITPTGNDVVLSWPKPAEGFLLEEAGQMTPGPLWNPVPNSYQTNATHIWVTVPKGAKGSVFRLMKN